MSGNDNLNIQEPQHSIYSPSPRWWTKQLLPTPQRAWLGADPPHPTRRGEVWPKVLDAIKSLIIVITVDHHHIALPLNWRLCRV